MVYECEYCGYITNRKGNFLKHKNRKNPCSSYDDSHSYECDICKRMLSSKYALQVHKTRCKGAEALTCPTCKKTFTTYQGKHQHIKNVRCVSRGLPSESSHSVPDRGLCRGLPSECRRRSKSSHSVPDRGLSHFTLTSKGLCRGLPSVSRRRSVSRGLPSESSHSVWDRGLSHFTLTSKGMTNESLSHLLRDKDLIYKTNQLSKRGVYGLVDIVGLIFFDPKHSENHTLFRKKQRGKEVWIRNENNEWEFRHYDDIRQDIVNAISNYFKIYNQQKNALKIKLTESKERNRMRKFISMFISLGGTVDDDLCEELDVASLGSNLCQGQSGSNLCQGQSEKKFDTGTLNQIFKRSKSLLL